MEHPALLPEPLTQTPSWNHFTSPAALSHPSFPNHGRPGKNSSAFFCLFAGGVACLMAGALQEGSFCCFLMASNSPYC